VQNVEKVSITIKPIKERGNIDAEENRKTRSQRRIFVKIEISPNSNS